MPHALLTITNYPNSAMTNNLEQPREYDAVLGGQTPAPMGSLILGGLEGVKWRLASPIIEQRISALHESLKYGEAGLNLVIQALDNNFWKVRKAAYSLLETRKDPLIEKVLEEYNAKNNRYTLFVNMARSGKAHNIDKLMDALENNQNCATYKLVDYALSLVETTAGKERIKHYLFNGTQMQRNYAALFFKRLGMKEFLTLAVNQGCIDRVQAFSK